MGLGQPGRRGRGLVRVEPTGSAQVEKDRFSLFFFEIFFSVQKQIQEMPRKCLETRKIPRKFRKFQKNS
jgi:hypothetical protein